MKTVFAVIALLGAVIVIASVVDRRPADPVLLTHAQEATAMATPVMATPVLTPHERMPAPLAPAQPSIPTLVVRYQKGLLAINARDASLREILNRVHESTGADIDGGGVEDRVSVELGPRPPVQVIASLLQGQHLNYAILGDTRKRSLLRRVVVMPESAGAARALGPLEVAAPQVSPNPAARARHIDETGGDEGVWDDELQKVR